MDFGEAAPATGIIPFRSHRLLRAQPVSVALQQSSSRTYQKRKRLSFIWARSTWAGSQRYPLHWGGDAATTNTAMSATLRGGLSLGLSGFSFWSHDVGGFVTAAPEDLYRRWTPFGMLSSHVRSHGEPPTEPWLYNENFLKAFRKADNMRYQLMPYIYAQAKESSEQGLPMMRRSLLNSPMIPEPGLLTINTCLVPVCWWHRFLKKPGSAGVSS